MASPICTVDGSSTAASAVNVTASTTVTIALADTAGVTQWNLTCLTADGLTSVATINSSLTINLINKTATLAVPAALGSAFIFQSKVNNGLDINGLSNPAYTTTFKINVLTVSGLPVTAFNENMEQSISFGWTEILNNMIRQYTSISTSSGNGLTGFYNVGQNADGSIVVNANDIQLKASYQTLLNNATSSATNGSLALRNGVGGCVFIAMACTTATVAGAATVGTTLDVTGLSTLGSLGVTGAATVGTTLGVTGLSTLGSLGVTGAATVGTTLGVTTSITSPSYLFTADIAGISRHMKIAITDGSWTNDNFGTYTASVNDASELFYPIYLPHGVKITSISVSVIGAAGHTFPIQNPPKLTTSFGDFAIDPNITTGTYEILHNITISGLSNIVNGSLDNHVILRNEYGTNSIAGLNVTKITIVYTRLAGSSAGQD